MANAIQGFTQGLGTGGQLAQMRAQMEERRRQERKRQQLSELAAPVLGGDQESLMKLAGSNPEAASSLIGLRSQMTQSALEQQQALASQRRRDMLGMIAATQAAPEGQRQQRWQQMRQEALQTYPDAQLPEQYDEQLAQSYARELLPEEELVKLFRPKEPQKPVSVGRGSRLVDPTTGKVIVGAEPKEPDQRDRKIDSLYQQLVARGMDETAARQRATNVVDGVARIELVPETGQARYVNEATGEVDEIPVRSEATDQPSPGRDVSLWDMADDATGPVSAARAGASTISGMFGGPIAEDTVRARQAFQLETQNLVRALSINPRFPVAEMERIRQEVDIQPSVLDNPSMLRERMKEIDSSLRNRLQQAERDAADASNPQEVRESAASAAANIRNFLANMGVPRGGSGDDDIQSLIDQYAPDE